MLITKIFSRLSNIQKKMIQNTLITLPLTAFTLSGGIDIIQGENKFETDFVNIFSNEIDWYDIARKEAQIDEAEVATPDPILLEDTEENINSDEDETANTANYYIFGGLIILGFILISLCSSYGFWKLFCKNSRKHKTKLSDKKDVSQNELEMGKSSVTPLATTEKKLEDALSEENKVEEGNSTASSGQVPELQPECPFPPTFESFREISKKEKVTIIKLEYLQSITSHQEPENHEKEIDSKPTEKDSDEKGDTLSDSKMREDTCFADFPEDAESKQEDGKKESEISDTSKEEGCQKQSELTVADEAVSMMKEGKSSAEEHAKDTESKNEESEMSEATKQAEVVSAEEEKKASNHEVNQKTSDISRHVEKLVFEKESSAEAYPLKNLENIMETLQELDKKLCGDDEALKFRIKEELESKLSRSSRRSMRNKVEKTVQCYNCKKLFGDKKDMEKHFREIHIASIVHANASTSTSIQIIQETGNDTKTFSREHSKTKSVRKSSKMIHCTFCKDSTAFQSRSEYQNHIRSKHNVIHNYQ